MTRIKSWLESCLSGHAVCSQIGRAGQFDARNATLPTRCIDVRDDRPRLSDTLGGRGTYITLSHRWNSQAFTYRTTKLNLESRKQTLEIENLPSTFHDAIAIAKHLNIPFLWIDSVCIIQALSDEDDTHDWLKEAPKIGQYYSHSIFTLSVGAAPSEGIEHPPEPNNAIMGLLIRLSYRDKDEIEDGQIYIHRRRQNVVYDYIDIVRKSELFSRGWILQEWLLSRRIVHYNSGSLLFFECLTESATDEWNQSVKLNLDPEGYDLGLKMQFYRKSLSNTHGIWYRVLENFTSRELMFPAKDRLMAVAGIAGEYEAIKF